MGLAKRTFAVAAGADTNLQAVPGGLFGIFVKEVTAVAAPGTVQVFDNAAAAAGTAIVTVRLATNSQRLIKFPRGVRFDNGLHIAAAGADINGHLLVGSTAGLRAIPFAGVDVLLHTGPIDLYQVVAAETAGAAADWRLIDDVVVAGNGFVGASHVANETVDYTFDQGIRIDTGLQYDQLAGATSGAVYIG